MVDYESILRMLGDKGDKATSRTGSGFSEGDSKATGGDTQATAGGNFEVVAPVSPACRPVTSRTGSGLSPLSPLSPDLAGKRASGQEFKTVSTWWEWSEDDIHIFTKWAKQNPTEAHAFILQEVEKVRYYLNNLKLKNVTQMIA
jgi:hypothetical protein